MARMLVETLAGDYDPSEYEDDYRSAVESLVQAKLEGGEVRKAPEVEKKTGEVVDLLAALQRSVEAAKSSRGESAATAEEPEEAPEEATPKRSTAKKTTARTEKKAEKKAPAKKTASKKSTAKKTTAKKTAKKAS